MVFSWQSSTTPRPSGLGEISSEDYNRENSLKTHWGTTRSICDEEPGVAEQNSRYEINIKTPISEHVRYLVAENLSVFS